MVRRTTAAVVMAIAAATLMSAAATGAVAGDERISRLVLRDGTGDVWAGDDGKSLSEWTLQVDARPAVDLTRTRIAHRTHAIAVRMRFANLRRRGEQVYMLDLLTPRGETRVRVYGGEGRGDGTHLIVEMVRDDGDPSSGTGADWALADCPRLAHDIDYRDDLVDIRIPRRCLAEPRWVRAKVLNIMWADPVPPGPFGATDNAHNDGPAPEAFTRRLYRS